MKIEFSPQRLRNIIHCLGIAAERFEANAALIRAEEQATGKSSGWIAAQFDKQAIEARAEIEGLEVALEMSEREGA